MKKLFPLFVCFSICSYADTFKELEKIPESPSNSSQRIQIKSLSDLQRITPYTSISVIQKRYLPKTFRAEFNLSLSSIINHTFFYLGGASGRVGFFVREDHGFGFEGFAILPPIFKLVTKQMIGEPNHILPSSVVLPEFYFGGYYKWSPVFGKFAILDRKIIYFDSYMTVGGGMKWVLNGFEVIKKQIPGYQISDERSVPLLAQQFFPSLTIGLGQIFAINQSWAFNWELQWLYTFVKYQSGTLYTPINIKFSLGVNYYFPEASYR